MTTTHVARPATRRRLSPVHSPTRQFLGAFPYVLPALLIFIIFTYYPLARVIYLSFTDADMLSAAQWVGASNYRELFANSEFWSSFRITVTFAVAVTLLEVVLGMGLAFLMNAPIRLRTALRGAVFAPVVVSLAATGVVWSYLLSPNAGPVNALLGTLGLGQPGWLTDPKTALASVIMVAVWKGVGLPAVLFLAGLQGIPRELDEAASIDGANRWTIARRITIPMLAPTTLVVFFISLMGTFQSYGLVLLLTRGGPAGSTNLLGYHIYQNAFSFFQMGLASAMSVALFLLLLALGFLQFKLAERRVHYQ